MKIYESVKSNSNLFRHSCTKACYSIYFPLIHSTCFILFVFLTLKLFNFSGNLFPREPMREAGVNDST